MTVELAVIGTAALDHKSNQTSVSVFIVPFGLGLARPWFWCRAFLVFVSHSCSGSGDGTCFCSCDCGVLG